MHKKRVSNFSPAGHASQLGRQVGAVPGPITSAASAGCHKLVRDYDAVLVTNVQEACELAGLDDTSALFSLDGGAGGEGSNGGDHRDSAWTRRVCDALPLRGYRDLPAIARLAGLSPEQTRGMLAELELLDRVRRRDPTEGVAVQWGLIK